MTSTSSLSSFGRPDCPDIDTVPLFELLFADWSTVITDICGGSIILEAYCKALTLGKSCCIHDSGGKKGECIVPNAEVHK